VQLHNKQKPVYWHSPGARDANALYDADTGLEEKDEEKHKEVEWAVTSTTDKHTQILTFTGLTASRFYILLDTK